MLARGALCRLAAEVPKPATHDLPKLATLVQTARSVFSLPIRTLAHVSQLQTRSYATTKAAKDPAAPVKKAVKAKAAAGKKVTKTTSTKKVAAKKAKKKAAPKKPAKKPKKVLTEEEKLRVQVKQLRKIALREPVAPTQLTAYNVYIADTFKGEKGTQSFNEVVKAFQDITPAEREKWNHLAAERNAARAAEYDAWVKSHTAEEIRLANNARKLLKRKLADKIKGTPAHTRLIKDDRQPKRPTTAWNLFFAERQASPDFQGINVTERAKLMSAEWKALSASEKQRFEDQHAADFQRYTREKSA